MTKQNSFDAAILMATAMLFIPGIAQGHAMLDHAEPAAGSTVDIPPGRVVAHFDQPVNASASSLRVIDGAGAQVDKSDSRLDPNDSSTVVVSVNDLVSGTYTVQWKALCECGHHTHGSFTFTVHRKG